MRALEWIALPVVACLFACAGGAPNATRAESNSASGAQLACSDGPPVRLAEVKRVVHDRCLSCHSKGGEAGEDFDWTVERVLTAYRRNVGAQVADGAMPPLGAPRLDPSERRTLVCWGQSKDSAAAWLSAPITGLRSHQSE